MATTTMIHNYGATEHQLSLYVVHLRQEGLQPQTIRTHLSQFLFISTLEDSIHQPTPPL